MPKGKGSGIMGSKVGDYKGSPKMPECRGDKGTSSAAGAKEGKSVTFGHGGK